ncbi:zinc finger, C2H5-type domain containing protein [Rhodotorula toruloides]|uniref:Zinc finger, C2H5-type domain containing protein n=1 Tax=Rhodotorula toruloides TaxID=5286 RepID=A0A511KEU0_RHOTO|nr:zinc finger, C2H5-type domain containing protein [Rhodotorula toruloides]
MSSEPIPDQQDGITCAQNAMPQDERLERGEAETITVPRKRAASPFSLSRQDSQRPFAFKRNSSSGFSAFMNYAAAASTSEVRTRPATPAESATRSTFDEAIRTLAMPASTSGSTDDASASTPNDMDVSSTSAPVPRTANGPTADGSFDDRPKGQGTLELERVLGLWAAKTPTNSFPNLPPLPNASSPSSAPSTSQPLFVQSVVTAEPESIDFAASSSQAEQSGITSASFSSIFVDFANLASQQPTSASSRDSLALPRDLPRRQRSKSEADIMRLDTLGFGGPTALDFSSSSTPFTPTSAAFNFSLDFGARFLPTFSQQAPTPPVQASPSSVPPPAESADMPWRPPSAPSAYPFPPTSSTAQARPFLLQTDQRELQLRVRTPIGMQRSAGGPGYREAALLDVGLAGVGMDRGRRARSQGAGHRRAAKSDDFTHMFSPTTGASFAQQQQQATFETSNGQLAPPSEAPLSNIQQQSYPPHQLQEQVSPHSHYVSPQPHQALQLPRHSPHQHHQHPSPQPQVIYLPNGTPLPVAYFGVDTAVAQAVSQAPQPQHHQSPPQPQQQLQPPPGYPRGAQFSPEGNALALAAAQAAQAHAAQQIAAAAAAALQFANGGVGHQQQQQQRPPPPPSRQPARRSIGGEPSHSTEYTAAPHAHSHLPPALPPPPGQPNFFSGPGGQHQRTPYMYHSTLAHATLPSPPMSARNEVKRARDEEGEGVREEEDESEDDELVDDEEYEDDEEEYVHSRSGHRAKGSAVVKGKAAASASKPKAKKPAAPRKVASGSGGENGSDEFTKESKTTQATIDAAKRRRNANAVAKFVCELCGETFTRRYNLRGHQRAHKGEKPYKCSYEGCDKAFARAHDCKRHELLHLGVRKYHCSPCNRDFVRLDALHRHHRSEVGQACVQKLQAEGAQFDERGAIVATDL